MTKWSQIAARRMGYTIFFLSAFLFSYQMGSLDFSQLIEILNLIASWPIVVLLIVILVLDSFPFGLADFLKNLRLQYKNGEHDVSVELREDPRVASLAEKSIIDQKNVENLTKEVEQIEVADSGEVTYTAEEWSEFTEKITTLLDGFQNLVKDRTELLEIYIFRFLDLSLSDESKRSLAAVKDKSLRRDDFNARYIDNWVNNYKFLPGSQIISPLIRERLIKEGENGKLSITSLGKKYLNHLSNRNP